MSQIFLQLILKLFFFSFIFIFCYCVSCVHGVDQRLYLVVVWKSVVLTNGSHISLNQLLFSRKFLPTICSTFFKHKPAFTLARSQPRTTAFQKPQFTVNFEIETLLCLRQD